MEHSPEMVQEMARQEITRREHGKDALHARADNDFRYHAPTPEQLPKYEALRDYARTFAHLLIDSVPQGRELSTALTKLEECVMTANAGIARHG